MGLADVARPRHRMASNSINDDVAGNVCRALPRMPCPYRPPPPLRPAPFPPPQRAWQIMPTTSLDACQLENAIQLEDSERVPMTWRAILAAPYLPTRVLAASGGGLSSSARRRRRGCGRGRGRRRGGEKGQEVSPARCATGRGDGDGTSHQSSVARTSRARARGHIRGRRPEVSEHG
jgi:hypothetical protein